MTATLAAVAAVLRGQLGTQETPQNDVAYNTWQYGRRVNGPQFPWCDVFQCWAFEQAGALALIGGRNTYTPAHAAWFQQRGAWSRTPRVGALVFFDWGTRIAHVGWVESLTPGGFLSIEGNTDAKGGRTGGKVMRQRRSLGSIGKRGGFGLISYAPAEAPASTVAAQSSGRTGALTEDGDLGPATRMALQRALGVTADGDLGPASIRALQRALGAPADGKLGPATVRALQTRLGIAADGDWGKATTRALQTRLNRGGL